DPASRAAVVGDRGAERRQRAAPPVDEAGDEAWERSSSPGGMGIGDEELVRVRRAELAAELPPALRGREGLSVVRRAGRGDQPTGVIDGEAVDLGRGDACSDNLPSAAVEE